MRLIPLLALVVSCSASSFPCGPSFVPCTQKKAFSSLIREFITVSIHFDLDFSFQRLNTKRNSKKLS